MDTSFGRAAGYSESSDQWLNVISDPIGTGMVLLDASLRVLAINQIARHILVASEVVVGSSEQLEFVDPHTQRAFMVAIGANDESRAEIAKRHWFPVRDRRRAMRARAAAIHLRADAAPVRREPLSYLLLVCGDPRILEYPHLALIELYGLTPAEAAVASCVLKHSSTCAIARYLGLSPHTVKTHLKHIFRKCNVHSITELAVLVATGPR